MFNERGRVYGPERFYVDWERLFEVLVALMVVSFLLERALALLFETRAHINQ